jgi:hypothetical protein
MGIETKGQYEGDLTGQIANEGVKNFNLEENKILTGVEGTTERIKKAAEGIRAIHKELRLDTILYDKVFPYDDILNEIDPADTDKTVVKIRNIFREAHKNMEALEQRRDALKAIQESEEEGFGNKERKKAIEDRLVDIKNEEVLKSMED